MTDPHDWGEWPTCAYCGRRRQTACPSCGMAGTDLPLAEYLAGGEPLRDSRQPLRQPATLPEDEQHYAAPPAGGENRTGAEGEQVWLLCPQCDEAFVPQFYRFCPACGGDAGSGIAMPPTLDQSLSKRVLLVVYCLAALGGLLLLYFWFLFRRP